MKGLISCSVACRFYDPTMLDENEFLKCPSCRHIDTILKYGQKYCHHCGQSIDWSEIK